jgi:hypothetical protein
MRGQQVRMSAAVSLLSKSMPVLQSGVSDYFRYPGGYVAARSADGHEQGSCKLHILAFGVVCPWCT